MVFVKFLLALLLFTTTLFSSTTSSKFVYAKKNYVTAVLKDDKQKEIIYLKQIVKYGEKLGKNVKKYKKELQKIDKKSKITLNKKITKEKVDKSFNIKSVYTNENTIVINFNHNISSKDIDFSEAKSKNRYQDIFDFRGRFKDARPTKLRLRGVGKITIFQYRYNTLRIILSNPTNLKTIYILNKKQIIIKVFNIKKKKEPIKIIPKKSIKINKSDKAKILEKKDIGLITSNKVIVIDPGHGGKDPGAVGTNKKYEKYVTLAVSKYLKEELISKGFKIYLTRTKDKFKSLRYRTKYANQKDAAVFVSIHVNSTIKKNAKKAKGIETYFLSPARSERAKRVAAKENQADMNSMSYNSKNMLLTLLNNSKIISSQKMAIDIQKNMLYQLQKTYGKKSIIDGGVREAPFWVLVGAQMPSVLIELGYISHPVEGKRLYSKVYQKKLAIGIAQGIISYFRHNP